MRVNRNREDMKQVQYVALPWLRLNTVELARGSLRSYCKASTIRLLYVSLMLAREWSCKRSGEHSCVVNNLP